MTLKLISEEDCSTKGGTRKLDRSDRKVCLAYKLQKDRKQWESIFSERHLIDEIDPKFGKVRIKATIFYKISEKWNFHLTEEDKKSLKLLDNIIFHCIDEKGENIEMTYIIPTRLLEIRSNVGISKRFYKKRWYSKYRASDEDLKRYNDEYHKIVAPSSLNSI